MRVLVSVLSASDPFYKKRIEQFANGIKKCGDFVYFDNTHRLGDVAVIYGSVKTNRGRSEHSVKRRLTEKFEKYVQIETPLVGRIINPLHKNFRVGINGFMWNTADWGLEHLTVERSTKFWKKFNYQQKDNWKTHGSHVLVCMQKWGDASLGNVDTYDWCWNTVAKLRQYTDRHIVVRPHPIYRKKVKMADLREKLLAVENVSWRDTDFRQRGEHSTIAEDLEDCWCTVTHTSGSAVDSVLHGVPNIATGEGNMAWPVSSHSLEEVENPFRGDKSEWLNMIAHCQWSVEEFESGECWAHVRKSL